MDSITVLFTPATKTRLFLLFAPPRICTLPFDTPNRSARKATQASFALPSKGGAVIFIFSEPFWIPVIPDRDERGRTRMVKMIPSVVSVM